MSKLPRLTPQEAERLLIANGFQLLRTKGSHHIYGKGSLRIVVPFHAGKTLHPKIVKEIMRVIKESS